MIVLVIAGHVLKEKQFDNISECIIAWQWIYIFHIPLFVFISGYFTRKKNRKNFFSSIWKLLEPLILFQIIAIAPKLISNGFVPLSDILTPRWILWYLLSLIFWRIILQILPDKLLNNTKLIICIAFCISIIAGYLPFDRFLSLQRTLSFMPFFFLGYFMKDKNLFLPQKYKSLCFVFLIISFAIPIFFSQYLGSMTHADPYGNKLGAIQRIIVFSLSIPMSLAFINICPNTKWIAKQGKLTMQYYLYHALVIPPLMVVVTVLGIPFSLFTAILYTLIITIGIGVILYLPYIGKLTNPSLFIKSKMRMRLF